MRVPGTYLDTFETVRYLLQSPYLLINRESLLPSTMEAFAATFNSDADNGETEDGYARSDLEDVMEQGEIGEQIEDIENAVGVSNADEDQHLKTRSSTLRYSAQS